MEIKVIHLGLIKTNCYMIKSDKAAIVIDPGFVTETTVEFLNGNRDKERLILLTHAHFDHIGGAEALRATTNVKIGIGNIDASALKDTAVNLSDQFHAHIAPFEADLLFKDGEIINAGDMKIKVISTPGHTRGGVSYLIDDSLFSGDTLFQGSIGRTDFPGGDIKALKKSVRKLIALGNHVKIYPGHGDATNVAIEKENNFFIW